MTSDCVHLKMMPFLKSTSSLSVCECKCSVHEFGEG